MRARFLAPLERNAGLRNDAIGIAGNPASWLQSDKKGTLLPEHCRSFGVVDGFAGDHRPKNFCVAHLFR